MREKKLVITGAGGFIGKTLVPFLEKCSYTISAWHRKDGSYSISPNIEITERTRKDWQRRLTGSDAVIHLAGLAHQLNDRGTAEQQYALINTDATAQLAHAALAAGVKRFIFISTAKVFGEGGDTIYSTQSPAQPMDAYARSKWHAEQQLQAITTNSTMELVVIRPPLVYGANAKANFAQLQKLSILPFPLPFASLRNRRDMIALDNLVDLIELCIHHPAAAGGTWLCADAQPYSLAEIIAAMRLANGRRRAMFPFPPALLRGIFSAILGAARAEKALGDFQLDCSATHAMLGWRPQRTMRDIFIAADRRSAK
jgi:nucleoside-diphosphate-sugar epimerase